MTTTAAAHTALSSCLNHDPNKWVVRGSVLTTENEDALTICRTICPRREACLQEILERGPKCRPLGMIEGGVWWDQHGNPAVWTPTPKEEPVNTHQYLSELRKQVGKCLFADGRHQPINVKRGAHMISFRLLSKVSEICSTSGPDPADPSACSIRTRSKCPVQGAG